MSSTPTVGSFLFDYLYSKGIKDAFGIPGDFALPTFRWLHQSPIELYTMTHEPSVGFAADGYARVNGLGLAEKQVGFPPLRSRRNGSPRLRVSGRSGDGGLLGCLVDGAAVSVKGRNMHRSTFP